MWRDQCCRNVSWIEMSRCAGLRCRRGRQHRRKYGDRGMQASDERGHRSSELDGGSPSQPVDCTMPPIAWITSSDACQVACGTGLAEGRDTGDDELRVVAAQASHRQLASIESTRAEILNQPVHLLSISSSCLAPEGGGQVDGDALFVAIDVTQDVCVEGLGPRVDGDDVGAKLAEQQTGVGGRGAGRQLEDSHPSSRGRPSRAAKVGSRGMPGASGTSSMRNGPPTVSAPQVCRLSTSSRLRPSQRCSTAKLSAPFGRMSLDMARRRPITVHGMAGCGWLRTPSSGRGCTTGWNTSRVARCGSNNRSSTWLTGPAAMPRACSSAARSFLSRARVHSASRASISSCAA